MTQDMVESSILESSIKNPNRSFGNIKSMIAWKVWQDICDMMSKLAEYDIEITNKVTHHDLSITGLSG